MNWGFCADTCIIISGLGFLFMFYLFILCVADPDRLHIIHHHDKEEDHHSYMTAWVSAMFAALIYLVIGGVLFYKRYGQKEDWNKLVDGWRQFLEAKDDYGMEDYARGKTSIARLNNPAIELRNNTD